MNNEYVLPGGVSSLIREEIQAGYAEMTKIFKPKPASAFEKDSGQPVKGIVQDKSSLVLWGHDHDDWLVGAEKSDFLFGRQGDDAMFGNDGNDILMGGAGDDLVWGGKGADFFIFRRGDGKDIIWDFSSAEADSLVIDKRLVGDFAQLISQVENDKGDMIIRFDDQTHIRLCDTVTLDITDVIFI